MAQKPDLQSALDCFVAMVKAAMNTQCCSIYFADYAQDDFVLMASDGLNPDAVGHFRIGFTEGLVGLVAQREEPINLADAHLHPRFILSDEVNEAHFRAFLSVPVVHQRKVLGVIVVQQSEARSFSQDEEAFLITLSAQLASQLASQETAELLNQAANHTQVAYLKGIASAPGIAIGQGYVVVPQFSFEKVAITKTDDISGQIKAFHRAVAATRREFQILSKQLADDTPKEALDVFFVYQQLLDAQSLGDSVEAEINAGLTAASALKNVVERLVAEFSQMQDAYLKERAQDVKDIGLRVLFHLLHQEKPQRDFPDNAILITDTLTPSMLVDAPKDKLKGVVSVYGAANSHASILTKAMNIPAIWGINDVPLMPFEGQNVVLDAYTGRLYVAPTANLIREYQALKDEESQLAELYHSEAGMPSITQDGEHFHLMLNAGLEVDVPSEELITDGVGLFRTEAWFMQHHYFPSQQMQTEYYRKVLSDHHPNPVVMRTLDIGGDKALAYFNVAEDNPFLGWRGLRMMLDHPELFLDQLKAMLRANAGLGNLKIMLPMVSSVSEVIDAKRLLKQAYFELEEEWQDLQEPLEMPELGIMIEVPSSVFLMPEWANEVDFCSVGSNDLTQYLLAVDRTNNRVAELFDPFHPAVLRVLNQIARQCEYHELPFSLCGELAAEPEGALLLLAMGFRVLSMNGASIEKIRWVLRRCDTMVLEQLLKHCLGATDAKAVKRILRHYMNEQGFDHILYSLTPQPQVNTTH